MKYFIIFNLLAITTIHLIVNAHENHDHKTYSWPNSKNKTIKTDATVNFDKIENKKNKTKNNYRSNWPKIFRR